MARPQLITVREAADTLGISLRTFRRRREPGGPLANLIIETQAHGREMFRKTQIKALAKTVALEKTGPKSKTA